MSNPRQALQQLTYPEKGAPFIQKKGSEGNNLQVSFSGFFCCRSMICRLKYILYPAADAVWSAELSSFCGWLPESMSWHRLNRSPLHLQCCENLAQGLLWLYIGHSDKCWAFIGYFQSHDQALRKNDLKQFLDSKILPKSIYLFFIHVLGVELP